MNNSTPVHPGRLVPAPLRWIAVWASMPLSGAVAGWAVGPSGAPGPSLAGGALVGLITGASVAWASTRPVAPTALAWSVGLAVGSTVGGAVVQSVPLAPGWPALLSSATAQAAGLGAAVLMLERSWRRSAVVAGAWVAGWVVSAGLVIGPAGTFHVFGASGAVVFTAALILAGRLHARGGLWPQAGQAGTEAAR